MPITRSKRQAGETIEEFYVKEDVGIAFVMTGKVMLKLIEFVNQNFTKTKLSVFTSHYTMCIRFLKNELIASSENYGKTKSNF